MTEPTCWCGERMLAVYDEATGDVATNRTAPGAGVPLCRSHFEEAKAEFASQVEPQLQPHREAVARGAKLVEARKFARALIRAGYTSVEVREDLSHGVVYVHSRNRAGMVREIHYPSDFHELMRLEG